MCPRNNQNVNPLRIECGGRGIHINDEIDKSSRVFRVWYGHYLLKSYSYGKSRTRQEAWDLAVAYLKQYAASHNLTVRESLEYNPETKY